MNEIFFKNYYYLLGIPKDASEEEIRSAIDELEGKRSKTLLYEIKMVLLNKELKCLYDKEYDLYSKSDTKHGYTIKDSELIKFYETTSLQEEIGTNFDTAEIVDGIDKSSRFKRTIIWTIIGLVSLCVIKCASGIIVAGSTY